MVEFYEYIFYRMYWFDVKKTRNFTPREGILSATLKMSVLGDLNFIFIAEGVNYIFNPSNRVCDMAYSLPPVIIIVALNYYYFSRKGRKDEIVNYWEKQATKEERFNMDVKLIAYIVLSFASVIWLAGWGV